MASTGAESRFRRMDLHCHSIEIEGVLVTATADEINAVADISERVVNLDATSLTIAAATHGERIILLSHTAATSTVTLPTATGTGSRYTFIVGAVNTNSHVIQVASASDTFEGIAFGAVGGGPNIINAFETAADTDTITLNGTTSGGAAIGDKIEIIDIASGQFHVLAHVSATGTEITPFSAAVS